MNILPKKRWHVRTKENIARVRKDEAEAAELAKQEQLRIEKADREARLSVLKLKNKQKLLELGITEDEPEKVLPSEHINLFTNLEDAIRTTNKEHDKELKDKKEEYEKKIGYLTYLGQDTNEALGKKNWYEVLPTALQSLSSTSIKDTYEKLVLKDADGKPKTSKPDEKDGEVGWKKKQMIDPMNAFKHLHGSHRDIKMSAQSKQKTKEHNTSIDKKYKHKHKKHKKHEDNDKKMKLQKLREARLRREQQEKCKTEMFLTGLSKQTTPNTEKDTKMKPKYNSQFNPELARQNYK